MEGKATRGQVTVFICKFCKKHFQYPRDLIHHKRLVHTEQIYNNTSPKRVYKNTRNELEEERQYSENNPTVGGFPDTVPVLLQSLQENSTTVDIKKKSESLTTLHDVLKHEASIAQEKSNKNTESSLLYLSTCKLTAYPSNSCVPPAQLIVKKAATLPQMLETVSNAKITDTVSQNLNPMTVQHLSVADNTNVPKESEANGVDQNLKFKLVKYENIMNQIAVQTKFKIPNSTLKIDIENTSGESKIEIVQDLPPATQNFSTAKCNKIWNLHSSDEPQILRKERKSNKALQVEVQNVSQVLHSVKTATVNKNVNRATIQTQTNVSSPSAKHCIRKKRKTTSTAQTFKCSFCPKTLRRKSGKMLHERTHTHLVKCTECHAKFVTRVQLEHHYKKTNCSDRQVREAEIRKIVEGFCNSIHYSPTTSVPNAGYLFSYERPLATCKSPQIQHRRTSPYSTSPVAWRPATPFPTPHFARRPDTPLRTPQVAWRPATPFRTPQVARRPTTPFGTPRIANRPATAFGSRQVAWRPKSPYKTPLTTNQPQLQHPQSDHSDSQATPQNASKIKVLLQCAFQKIFQLP